MGTQQAPKAGSITWCDLTVPDAVQVRDFYAAVVGWETQSVSMDGYDDFCMTVPDQGEAVAGICHARGSNSHLPSQWLIYITVTDLDKSLNKCIELGGKALTEIRSLGGSGRFCAIQDPGGAVAALYQP